MAEFNWSCERDIIFVVPKQTQRVFVLDVNLPFLKSQKQNRGGTHNYTVAKPVLVIFPKTDGESEEGTAKVFNTQ